MHAFAWGYWNDPGLEDLKGIKLFKVRNKAQSVKGYQRFMQLISTNFSSTNWYKLQKQSVFKLLKVSGKVKVKEAVEARLQIRR